MQRVPLQKAMLAVFDIDNEACLCQESRSPQRIVENGKTAPWDQSLVQLVAFSQGKHSYVYLGGLLQVLTQVYARSKRCV